ncbi:MAG: NUDIX domain-containing protein [Deltaproteobacteria bacterium]
MRKKARIFCPYCGAKTIKKTEDDILRDFCQSCKTFFYENPLPVVSTIIVLERKILLVKRGKNPYRGLWCPPTGFAEAGESVEDAALRELDEETGIQGNILSLIDVDSCTNYFYGDLLFITFEVEQIGGTLGPGGDTTDVKYFAVEQIPKLAFSSNTRAVNAYIKGKADYWAIVDSFARSTGQMKIRGERENLLSDRLLVVIEKNAEKIANLWVHDVTTGRSTPDYHDFDKARLFKRIHRLLSQFGKWLGGFYGDSDIREFFMETGRERKKEGFKLGEVLSALSLIKKHIWEFALSQGMWQKTLDIYTALELDRRIVIFFDRAAFYMTRGYEE